MGQAEPSRRPTASAAASSASSSSPSWGFWEKGVGFGEAGVGPGLGPPFPLDDFRGIAAEQNSFGAWGDGRTGGCVGGARVGPEYAAVE